MFNKKIFLSIFTIGIVSVMTGSSTWGYFEDTETSTGNSFSAGTLDLSLTSAPFSVGNIAPGNSDKQTQELTNSGTLNGKLKISLSTITNTEGTSSEFEPSPGSVGELGGVATMSIFLDSDNSTSITSGDIALTASGTQSSSTVTSVPSSPNENDYFETINSYSGRTWDSSLLSLNSKQTRNVIVYWKLPSTADNTTQGDSISFDMTFILEQNED